MNRFKQAYVKALTENVRAHPEDYAPIVVRGNIGDTVIATNDLGTKMLAALDRRSYNKDSKSFRDACRELGIKHTYAAINAVLDEGE